MAEHHQLQAHHPTEGIKSLLPNQGPSASKILTVATLFPIGGFLLALSGITLTGTVIGLAVATPLFVIFSPVLVPAAIVIGLAVAGFLTSGAMGLTALTSLSWILNYVKEARNRVPEQVDYAKKRMADAAQYAGQRTKDVGHRIQTQAQEVAGEKERR